MKKKWYLPCRQRHGLRKALMIMKLTMSMLLIAVMSFATEGYSQSARMNLKMENATMVDIFQEIERISEFGFLFKNDQIDLNKKYSINLEDVKIDEVLNQVLSEDYSYRILGKNIIITRESQMIGQQKMKISGKVTDTSGQPLPGVTVVVKGTTNGTITNFDGVYALSDVPSDGIIQFSFVGMKMQEIAVAGKTSIDIVMEEDAIGIEEVVAIGYGTIKKQAVTGSVSKAKLEVFENVPVNNVLESIKGSVAGLNVGGTNTAGQVASISIRGQNSIAAQNTPLIVVDGVIFSGSLADIPSNDIENLTVLKDASAAAVYGSRSANGVIIIETKKGSGIKGKPKFDLKVSYGISNQLKPLELYSGEAYIQRLLDTRWALGEEATPEHIEYYLTEEERINYLATPDHKPTITDPFGPFSQLGNTVNTTFSISNNTEKTRYYISTNLIKQKGVILNDEFKHISGRINLESDLTDWFTLGVQSSYSLRDYSGSAISFFWTTGISPYGSLYNEDGSYKKYPQTYTGYSNPFMRIATDDVDIKNNLSGTVTGKIKVPWVKGLTYQTTYSNSVRWSEISEFYDKNTTQGESVNGYGSRQYGRTYNMLLDNMIKYNRTFAEKHFVDVTLLYSREHATWENMYAYAENFDNTVLGTYALENGAIQTVATGGGETDAIGMMGRATYTYDYKYSITGTIRRDGYSAFSKNKKWGVFPSVGLNWNISRENFMEDVKAINNLALRASYGKNGNQSIDAYSTLAKVATNQYIFYGDNSYAITQYISSLATNDLGWETTTGLNFGIDFILLDNRISGSIDGYNTRTNDLLFNLSLPNVSGMSSIKSNIGEIKNKGLEINLKTLNINSQDFKWYTDFAFSINRNKVVSILGEDNDGDGKEDDLISSGYFIGEPLSTIYDFKVIGMWQQEDVDNGTIRSGQRPGDWKLEDLNGDDVISSDEDRQILGSKKENFRWSMANTFQYKNFSLMLYFYSIWGGNGWYLSSKNTPHLDGYIKYGYVNHPVYDEWTRTNTDAMFPRSDYTYQARYDQGIKYFDRSFIKLQKVSLAYDVSDMVKQWGINGLSFSLSADNIFTYAPHWVGLDPETDSGVTVASVPSIRTYLFTMSLNF